MGGVEHVDIDGTWTPAAWNMWSVGFVAFHVDIETEAPTDLELSRGVATTVTGLLQYDGDRRSCGFRDRHCGLSRVKSTGTTIALFDAGRNAHKFRSEIEAAYQLLVETWQDRNTHEDNDRAWSSPSEECMFPREITQEDWAAGLGSDPSR